MSAGKAYNWHPAVTPKLTQEEMAAQGRRPFQTSGGIVFGTRPGAPQSRFDTQSGIGIGGKIGTEAHADAWQQFFRPSPTQPAATTPPASVNSGVAADENFGGGNPVDATTATPTAPPDPVAASIQSNQKWMQSNGFAFQPPPATPRAPLYNTQTNQIPAPNLNSDTSSLYQPADTKPSYYEDPTAPVAPKGWVTTSASQLDAIRQRYGNTNS